MKPPIPRILGYLRPFLIIMLILSPAAAEAQGSRWGHYIGEVKVRFGPGGRKMTLLENFVYVDPRKVAWGAPASSTIDGASIPRAFWTVIGGPFEGKYRDASVIHDVACDQRTKPWKDVHRAFYTAMRCSGVGETKAKIMYYAVYNFGPRWGIGPSLNSFFVSEKQPTAKDVRDIEAWIKKKNPDLKAIENAKSQSDSLPTR